MLIGFSFKNFMSFYEENIFTMEASTDTKFRELNTVQTNYGELIKSAFIFGANGSGKTNFVQAVSYMRKLILADLNQQRKMMHLKHFAFQELAEKTPSAFKVAFIANDVMYEYGFELLDGKVSKEYLYEKKAKRKMPVFVRESPDFNDITLSKEMDNVKNLTQNTRQDTLFLYWANGGNNEIAMRVYHWFESIQIFDAHMVTNHSTIKYLERKENGKESILDLLKTADTHILDFDITLSEQAKSLMDDFVEYVGEGMGSLPDIIKIRRNFYNRDWKQLGTMSWSIDYESSGTQKLFDLAGPIIDALENGQVIFIDEIDSSAL